jgi:hypothetical protein
LLKESFGGAAQSEKFKMELKGRLRQPNEKLTDLHRDIKRLVTLGYPDLDPKAREVIAIDGFIDSLGDADLALKIRERAPPSLDEALRAGLQQEVWTKDAARAQPNSTVKQKSVRVLGDDLLRVLSQKVDALQKQFQQSARTAAPAAQPPPEPVYHNTQTAQSSYSSESNTVAFTPSGNNSNVYHAPPSSPYYGAQRNNHGCWFCNSTEHWFRDCPHHRAQSSTQPSQLSQTSQFSQLSQFAQSSQYLQPPQNSQSSQLSQTSQISQTSQFAQSSAQLPQSVQPNARPVHKCCEELNKTSNVYLRAQIKRRPIHLLLDTGSDASMAPYELVAKHRCRIRRS